MEYITSVFQAIHSKIGKLLYIGKDPTWLKKEGIFFYKYEYILPKTIGSSGYIKEIPLPSLILLEWASVYESLVSSFRYKLFSEMQLGMKEKGGIHARSGIFMPFSIFVHLSRKDESIRQLVKCILLQNLLMSYSQFCFHRVGWKTT